MREIRIHGLGGQGATLLSRLLAGAFERTGWPAHVVAPRAPATKDARVTARVLVDDARTARDAIVLDPSLVADVPPDWLPEAGVILVASGVAPCWRMPGASRVVTVDAARIARSHGLGAYVVSAMAGAFAGATGALRLPALEASIVDSHLKSTALHVAACRAAYYAAAEATVDVVSQR
jgi:Pyruvate/2-oxoacid:ferredoxin oxidoreductase gamma subunit